MFLSDLNRGYDPRRYPLDAAGAAMWTFALSAPALFFAIMFVAPPHWNGVVLYPYELWNSSLMSPTSEPMALRFAVSGLIALASAAFTAYDAWKATPPTEPFISLKESDPRVYYGEGARRKLRLKLFSETGFDAKRGLYLAPHLPLPFDKEKANLLFIGAPDSGKSNVLRALVDQAIDRGDRVVLLCNKGDVASAFTTTDSILIAPHHRESHAIDLAADIADVGAAQQFAADVIPDSNPQFWSDCARAVLTDLILGAMAKHGSAWDAGTIVKAALSESHGIRDAIRSIMFSSEQLITSTDPEEDDAAVRRFDQFAAARLGVAKYAENAPLFHQPLAFQRLPGMQDASASVLAGI